MPKNLCVFGKETDDLFYLILWIVTFFFLLTEGILVYCLFRFAGQPGRKAAFFHGLFSLELIWTLIPAAILLFIAFTQIVLPPIFRSEIDCLFAAQRRR